MNQALQHLSLLIENPAPPGKLRTAALPAEELLPQAAKEIHYIKETLHSAYRSQSNAGVLRRYFKDLLASLTTLTDQLTITLRREGNLNFDHAGKFHPGTDGSSQLLQSLSGTITYIRNRFGDVTDHTLPVPLLFQSETQNTVRLHYSRIRKGLDHKKADKAICAIILHALDAVIHPRKSLRLAWNEYDFLQTFTASLSDFAADKRRKDYQRRLMLILFKTNFNHPGLYRHLRDTFEKELEAKTRKNRIRMLRDAMLNTEQVDVLPGPAFRREHRSLKDFCTEWLRQRSESEERDLKDEELAKEYLLQHGFRMSVPVSHMAVLLQWLHQKEKLPYKTFREAAEAFSRTHTDQHGNPFNDRTLAKKPGNNAILHFYLELKKLTEEFKETHNI